MLRRFIYLNTTAVRQYTSILDNGLMTSSVVTEKIDSTRGGKGNLKVIEGQVGKSTGSENMTTRSDTDEARFDRLVQAAKEYPKQLGWINVRDPETDLSHVVVSAIVSWECEVWVPPVAQLFSRASGVSDALGMLGAFVPAARAMGQELTGFPSEEQIGALQKFTSESAGKLVLVGDDGSTEWKITGSLDGEFLDGELDGRAIVVGKVKKVVPKDAWQSIIAMPGLNIVSRAKRRAQERTAPAPGQEDNYVKGPALVLDVLAVYL